MTGRPSPEKPYDQDDPKLRPWLSRPQYGSDGSQTPPQRLLEACDRFSYVVTRPGVDILGWFTESGGPAFGLAVAQVSSLAVAAIAALRMVGDIGIETFVASILGTAALGTGALLVPAARSRIESGEHTWQVTAAASFFTLVSVLSAMTGHGPRSGVPATYLVAVGFMSSRDDRQPVKSLRKWLSTVITAEPAEISE